MLSLAGFTGEALDVALGVSFAESGGYADAVGDLTLTDAKWGPSIGLFQVRSLRSPYEYAVADRYRQAWALTNGYYNAAAAFAISNGGADFTPWTCFRNGAYLAHKGQTYTIRTGHPRANLWSS